jgi:hypothetical protein
MEDDSATRHIYTRGRQGHQHGATGWGVFKHMFINAQCMRLHALLTLLFTHVHLLLHRQAGSRNCCSVLKHKETQRSVQISVHACSPALTSGALVSLLIL